MEVKCPTVGHEKPKFSIILGGFFHSPMANPPIYASSDDARNDRGVRPLRMKKPWVSICYRLWMMKLIKD